MAMHLIFSAMTEESHRLVGREMLQKPQRKLLPVILDILVAGINPSPFPQFLHVATAILRPADLP